MSDRAVRYENPYPPGVAERIYGPHAGPVAGVGFDPDLYEGEPHNTRWRWWIAFDRNRPTAEDPYDPASCFAGDVGLKVDWGRVYLDGEVSS